MLVASKDLLVKAREEGYAIGAFNAGNYTTFDAIITAAEELNAPVLVQVGDLLDPNAPESRLMTKPEAENFMLALRGRAKSTKVPVAIHLDHCRTFEGCMRMIALGASSVMIDASMKSFEENMELTKKVVEAARPCGVTVEAEIGHVSGANDAVGEIYTTVEEAQRFYTVTDVDILAVAIGTAHGVYASEPTLQYDRIKELKEDYLDYITAHALSLWDAKHPRYDALLKFCRAHNDLDDYAPHMEKWSDEEISNCAVTLCHMVDKMLATVLAKKAADFTENGGIRERMTAARLGRRKTQNEEIAALKRRIASLESENAALKEELKRAGA